MSKNIKLGVAALATTVALGFAAPSWAEDHGTIEVKNCGKVTLDMALLVPTDPLAGVLEPKEVKEGKSFKATLTLTHHPLFVGVSHVKPRVFRGVEAGFYGAAADKIDGKWHIALEKSEEGKCPEFKKKEHHKKPEEKPADESQTQQ